MVKGLRDPGVALVCPQLDSNKERMTTVVAIRWLDDVTRRAFQQHKVLNQNVGFMFLQRRRRWANIKQHWISVSCL